MWQSKFSFLPGSTCRPSGTAMLSDGSTAVLAVWAAQGRHPSRSGGRRGARPGVLVVGPQSTVPGSGVLTLVVSLPGIPVCLHGPLQLVGKEWKAEKEPIFTMEYINTHLGAKRPATLFKNTGSHELNKAFFRKLTAIPQAFPRFLRGAFPPTHILTPFRKPFPFSSNW